MWRGISVTLILLGFCGASLPCATLAQTVQSQSAGSTERGMDDPWPLAAMQFR